jgi:signal transduction histidine kinase
LLGSALLVAIGGAAFTVYVTHRSFERARWQSAELGRLSSRAMSDLDALARRFSHELHDQFGQTLNAIEANLVAMRNRREYSDGRIEDCLGLIKDGMSSVREVSQLLRPSILDDFGLDASLRWLAETFSDRTGIQVQYTSSFAQRMNGEVETQVFRIAQEALTNVGRHSGATEVKMELRREGSKVRLEVSDNGRGFEPVVSEGGLGLVGMRARARTAKGILLVNSKAGRGVAVQLEIPFVPEAA